MSYIAVVSLCESSGACKCFAAGHKKENLLKIKTYKASCLQVWLGPLRSFCFAPLHERQPTVTIERLRTMRTDTALEVEQFLECWALTGRASLLLEIEKDFGNSKV